MNGLTAVRVASRVMALIVLVASGVYVIVYLYRWEWNRAVMSGIFFLAAEIALIGTAIVTRLRALERQVGTGNGAAPGPADQERSRHFAWLEESSGGFGVFIPILLGAGVILSLIAWVVERVARFVTAPLAGERAVSPLAGLAVPDGGLLAANAGPAGPAGLASTTAIMSAPRRPHPAVRIAATVAVFAALGAGLWVLRDATQARPGGEGAGTTYVELEISTRETGATMAQLVDALWVACRLRLPADAALVSSEVDARGAAVLVVTPSLGPTDQRQFAGCLGDTVLDRVDADVTRVEARPDPPAP